MKVATAGDYDGVAISGRLAAALRAFGRWREVVGLQDDEIDRLVDHLWQWLTVGAGTEFDDWYLFRSDALDRWLPARLVDKASAVEVSPALLASLLRDVVEIVESSLFGAVVSDWSMSHLAHLEDVVRRYGVVLDDPTVFGSPSFGERRGWGEPLTGEEVARWRSVGAA